MASLLRRMRVSGWLLAPATLLVAIVFPALAYAAIDSAVPDSLPMIQYLVAAAYVLTAAMTLLEARAALGERDEPPVPDINDPVALGELPTVTAIVSAYLPNEQQLVADTIVHLATELRVAPGGLQIILAYNTPEDIPDIEAALRSLAELNVAFLPVRVPSSRSKAENVNAALSLARGEVTVLLDADHLPAADAAARALRWFAAGYDVVQGRCVIRNHRDSWLTRVVAVEFEQIYAVAHSGRSLAFDTAMFCGTNGWWRTSVLRRIGMDEQMLTEDIDSSVRALLGGHRMIHDRSVISTELAPPSAKAWWGQRMRWAQGWFQVTLKHQAAVLRSPRLSGELKCYWTYLLGWRELFPVLSLQIFALLLASVLQGRDFTWFQDPFLIVATALTFIAGPIAAAMTYRVALPDHRRQLRRWFFIYAGGSLVYTTVKNTVAMVAMVRELIGERGWIVTKRTAQRGRGKALAATSAAVLAALVVASSAPTDAGAAERRTMRLAPMASQLTLTGRAPVATMSVPLPRDWKSLSSTLRLRWQASPRVAPNSTLTVRFAGTIMAVVPVHPGTGSATVRIPLRDSPGDPLALKLSAQLHSRVDAACCQPDSATDAVIAIDPKRTSISLTGYRSRTRPLLADLPGSLVDTLGPRPTPLYVALPLTPSGNDVRAAALFSGAVARALSTRSLPIKVVTGATPAELDALPGHVVQIQPTGTPRAAVARRPDGRLIVTLAGAGNGALKAAWALSRQRPRFLAGSDAAVTTGLDGLVGPAPRTVPITPIEVLGTGDLEYQAAFRLPEAQEIIAGKARLVLNTAFDAPAGGRVEISLNGTPLMSRTLPRQGINQQRLVVDLVQQDIHATASSVALARLAPGDNFLSIKSNLPPGQPLGGAGDAQVPAFRVLPSSRVRYQGRPRSGRPTLDLWPWPHARLDGMVDATFVIPGAPTTSELSWTIGTIAEASRWTRTPVAPKVAIGPGRLPAGNVVVLGRDDLTTPVPLPAGAPATPRVGLLETYSSGDRQLLVAYGLRALRPLAFNYSSSKVRGIAAVVSPSGRIATIARAPTASGFAKRGLAWQIPAAMLAFGALALLLIRLRRVSRRLEELPPPQPTEPLDDAEIRAQLADWERLLAQDEHAKQPGATKPS